MGMTVTTSGNREISEQLRSLHDLMVNPSAINQHISESMRDGGTNKRGAELKGVPQHIRDAAPSRHKTAARLGAEPLYAMADAAAAVEARHSSAEATIIIGGKYARMFRRTEGPVVIVPVDKQWLAIPCDKRTYGKSPRNFPGMLDFFVIEEGVLAALAMRKTPKAPHREVISKPYKPARPHKPKTLPNPERDIVFWLKKKVTVPQDRELLPSDLEFIELAKMGIGRSIDDAIEKEMKGAMSE